MDSILNQGASRFVERLARLRGRIAAAAARAGRLAGSVGLLAVIKRVPDEEVERAVQAGLTELAENRVQNLIARPEGLELRTRLHLIGPLQSNKAKKAMARMAEFHALERVELVPLLEREAAALGKTLAVWIQVNVAAEPQKHGCPPEAAAGLARAVASAPRLQLRGLMTIAPLAEDPASARPHFRALAALSRELRAGGVLPPDASGLSMGMSSDFEVAIEEGATLVRVGSALFAEDAA